MNIYFCGIGGVGLGPLAEIAVDAGHTVEGSDTQRSLATKELEYVVSHITYKQDGSGVRMMHEFDGIDWFVYSSGIPDDNPDMVAARELGLKMSKRDELLNEIIRQSGQKLIAVAGTHGKTTTTAMLVWVFQQRGIPVSYSVGSQLSFGPSGKFDPQAEYFIYECDEFDRNFLRFHPDISLITSVDYDHPDTYPTRDDYYAAFDKFMRLSRLVITWEEDFSMEGLGEETLVHLIDKDKNDTSIIHLPGLHNRENAYLVYTMFIDHFGAKNDAEEVIRLLDTFPGTARRFEKLANNLYSDYGHHPTEIKATLQLAKELNNDVVLVYQPHQNVRQHEIKDDYTDDIFADASEIYWLPTYLTREKEGLAVLTPEELSEHLSDKSRLHFAELNGELWINLLEARERGALILGMGAGTIDEWLRSQIAIHHAANVLLIDKSGAFIMQQRDNKPDIANPGQISGFGGTVEPSDKSLRDAAARELREETNIAFSEEDLHYMALLSKTEADGSPTLVAYYILSGIDTSTLEIYEGQGFARIEQHDIDTANLTPLARKALHYYLEHNNGA